MKKTIIECLEPEGKDRVLLKFSQISGVIYATRPFSYPMVLKDEFYVKLDDGRKIMLDRDVFCGICTGSEIGKCASWDDSNKWWIVDDRSVSNAYIVNEDDSLSFKEKGSLFDRLAR